jgi:hypothetical protein
LPFALRALRGLRGFQTRRRLLLVGGDGFLLFGAAEDFVGLLGGSA